MGFTRFHRPIFSLCWLCLWSCVCICSTGCLALGIPSERLHDPADRGGLLGDWNSDVPYGPTEIGQELVHEGVVLVTPDDGLFCSEVSPLDVSPKTGCAIKPKEKAPEVPWPRFHPVPTRPVFGSPL
ncbi:hypothetical protein [Aporhodopirellula aestuarii]|uniref:Uncharacterized protein n=1 Tax=Aporhodopirellula aestuarii TaxID=2950107 RepID=A0ABT0U501_9BACT|nr:hypothetical protein [Aporhodopirellula aestuarii]MCM2372019.1 hypothetical protein [Aporhodopirellula aestuarii]